MWCSEPCFGVADQFPRRLVQSAGQSEQGIQAGITEAALEKADVGGMALRFGRESLLGHAGLSPAAAKDVAEDLGCGW